MRELIPTLYSPNPVTYFVKSQSGLKNTLMAGTFVTQMTVPVTLVDTHHLPPLLSTLDPPVSSISAVLALCGFSLGG